MYDSATKFIVIMNPKNNYESFAGQEHDIDEIAFNIAIHLLKKIERESIVEPQLITISNRIFIFMTCQTTAMIK